MKERSRPSVVALVLAWSLLALMLSSCVQVNVVDHPATPSGEQTSIASALNIAEEHDLAILAVEFDPPLETLSKMTDRREATLRVAVENKGYRKESKIKVVVKLIGDAPEQVVRQESLEIESLAAGEIRLVSFQGMLPANYQSHYRLAIELATVPGESRLANNYKDYDIRVTSTR